MRRAEGSPPYRKVCLYVLQRLGDVGDQVFHIFQTAAQSDQVSANTGGIQLLIGHLPVGSGSGVQAAGPGIGHVGLDGAQLQVLHEGFRSLPSAVKAEGDDAAGAIGHIFLGDLIILVALQAAVLDPVDFFVALQILCDGLGIGAVLLHTEGQAFQTQIQNEGALGALAAAEVPHQLGGALGDEGPAETEPLGVSDTVIAVIGSGQTGELVGMGGPVELAAVYDAAAHSAGVAVHVLGGGVGDDIRTPLEGTTVDGGGEGVVHDQRHAMGMGSLGELLDIQHRQSGIGDGLAKDGLGVGPEGGIQLFLRAVGIDEGGFQAHLLHGHREQVKAAAVDGRGCHDVVTAACDVEHRQEIGSLTGGGQHGSGAALQSADLGRHSVTGGIGQPGVEIAVGLQVEELAHILGGCIFKGRALNDRDLPGLTVPGGITSLNTQSLGSQFVHRSHLMVCQNIPYIVNAGGTFVNEK